MIALAAVSALALTAWLLNRFWRAPCILCGRSDRACLTCAREADKRMRGAQ